jgi:hypothetical protein
VSGLANKQISAHHAILIILIWVAALIRWAVGVPYPHFTDIDVVNFGLAADHFDILSHQPHPPGYIGYVLYLKLIGLVPGLESIELAKWGARIMGTACVPLAYWTCRQLTGKADARALWAAGLVTVHPILWFYGADGQSHSSEAFALLGLFGLAARWRRDPTPLRVLGLCFLGGLAGAFRPTIVVTAIPIALWLVWRQPWKLWLGGAAAGIAGIAAWWVPTILSVGSLDLYQRASDSLVGKLFLKNYSLLSSEWSWWAVRSNLLYTAFAGLLIAIPAIAWSRCNASWRRPLQLTIATGIVFYAVTFLSELGYVAGLCGLACLVPASWPEHPERQHHLRAAAAVAISIAWFIGAPPSFEVPGMARLLNPNLQSSQGVIARQSLFAELVCDPDHPHTLLITDRENNTLTRSASFACPGLVSGTQLYNFVLRRDLDVWVFMSESELLPVPSKVPVENGPPTTATLPWRFQRVLVGPGASDDLRARMRATTTCAPKILRPYEGQEITMEEYPVDCARRLKLSSHTIVVQPLEGKESP